MQNQMLHGGVLASIADSACAVAAISLLLPDCYAATINLQLSYLKPVTQGRFRAEGRCIRADKNVIFCDASVFDEKDGLVCTATSQLLAVPLRRSPAGLSGPASARKESQDTASLVLKDNGRWADITLGNQVNGIQENVSMALRRR